MKGLAIVLAIAAAVAGWFAAGGQQSDETLSATVAPNAKKKLTAIPERGDVPAIIRATTEPGTLSSFAKMSGFMLTLENATADDCRRWWLSMESADESLRRMLVERWAQLDPQGAYDTLKKDGVFQVFAPTLLTAWAAIDLETALDATLSEEANLYSVMTGAGKDNIERLYDLLIDRGVDHISPHQFAGIFHHLAEINPERAADLALRLQASSLGYRVALENVTNSWVATNPAGALAWARAVEDPSSREQALHLVARQWLGRNPVAAIAAMGDQIDFNNPRMGTHSLPTGRLDDADFENLLAQADSMPVEKAQNASHLFIAMVNGLRYGEHPQRLAEIESRLTLVTPNLEMGISEAAKNWARQDEDGLVEFINSVDNEAVRSAAIRGLVTQLSASDPKRTLEFLSGIDEPVSSLNAGILLKGAVKAGLSLDEIITQIPLSMRDQSLRNLTRNFEDSLSPLDLADFLTNQPAGQARDNELMFAAGHWATKDPQAAAAWVETMDPGNIQKNAAGNIATSWATIDLEAAVGWAGELDDPASRARALARAARVAATNDPVRAVSISGQIADPESRDRALVESLRALARQDPDRAIVLLEEIESDYGGYDQVRLEAEQSRILRAVIDRP